MQDAKSVNRSDHEVDHPDRETVEVRQGTGPRATVSILLVSVTLAALVGAALIGYFVLLQ